MRPESHPSVPTVRPLPKTFGWARAIAVFMFATSPLMASSAELAPSLLDDICSMSPRLDIEPTPGLPADQLLSCSGSNIGSVMVTPLRRRDAGNDLQLLIDTYKSSRVAQQLRGRMNCRLDSALPLQSPGVSNAAAISCKLVNGGWPHLLVLAQKDKLLFVAEGPPVSLPTLMSHLSSGRTMPRGEATEILQKIFGEGIRLASATDVARLRSDLADARTALAQGRYSSAEQLFRNVLAMQTRLLGDRDIALADTLLDLALSVSNQGRDEEALALFRRAEILLQQSAQESERARLASYQGYHAANRGRYDEALRFASAAVASWRKILSAPGLNLASIMGELNGNTAGNENALADDPQKLDKGELALALNLQASMALRVEELALAQAAAAESMALLTATRGLPRSWRADVLHTLGKISSAQGRISAAEQYLSAALDERKQSGGESPQLLPILASLARAYQREGMNTAAIITYRDIFARMKRLPPGIESPLNKEDLIPFGLAVTAFADTLTDETQKQGLYNEAFDAFGLLRPTVVEQTIARASARLANTNPELASLLDTLESADRARDAANMELSFETSLPDIQRSKLVEDQLIAKKLTAEKDVSRVQQQLAERFPDYLSLSAPRPISSMALRERLDVAEGVISFIVGREASFVQLVRRDGIWVARINDGNDALAESVASLRRAMEVQGSTVADFDMGLAHNLYQRLLGGLRDQLKVLNHLIIIPDGPLASLPFSLLIDESPKDKRYANADWLVHRASISHAPSLRAFYVQRSASAAVRPQRALLAFGNPSLTGASESGARSASSGSSSLSALASSCRQDGPAPGELLRALAPLPETENELNVVQRVLGSRGQEARLFTRDQATEARLRDESLSEYRVLYFATHGLLPGELKCQAEPGLVLSPPAAAKDRHEDGLLEASEIASLRLNADLVVLSACNTAGSNGRFGGDALSGLAEAFFHAGARRLVASHWQVPSKATADLMSSLFETLGPDLSGGTAKSLQTAQLALISREATAHPFFWAAFVLVGDGQVDTQLPIPRTSSAGGER